MTWAAIHGDERVRRLVLTECVTEESWFSKRPAMLPRFRALLLNLPVWCWFPMIRRVVASQYGDEDRGLRSAEIYLMPFLTPDGARLLRRHLAHLSAGKIAELVPKATELRIPTVTFGGGRRRVSPEELPSDVAAAIAGSLAS